MNDDALVDALRLLGAVQSHDLLRVASVIGQMRPEDCRDLSVNLAHIIAMAADRVSI